jgi:hypothetical protein
VRRIFTGKILGVKMQPKANFDFSKSPIYFYNKRRMTWNQIEGNLPWLYKTIDDILDKSSK